MIVIGSDFFNAVIGNPLPKIGQFQFIYDWTIFFCKSIQNPVKIFRVDSLREFLRQVPVRYLNKGIIQRFVTDPLFLHFVSKPVMPIHIKLQAEWRPGGNTQIAQAKFFVNEIEVVMQAFKGNEVSAKVLFGSFSFKKRNARPARTLSTGFETRQNFNIF